VFLKPLEALLGLSRADLALVFGLSSVGFGVGMNLAPYVYGLTPGPVLVLDARQLDQVASLFKLLCDKTRLAILQILCEGEMNVTALCRRLKLPQPTVSHHLGLLRMNRLIANRRSGKQVYYKLHDRIEDRATADSDPRMGGLQIVDDGFAVHIATQSRAGTSMFSNLDSAVLHSPQ